jgi:hypothetical protein
LKYFKENRVFSYWICILECKYTTRYYAKLIEKYLRKSQFFEIIFEIFLFFGGRTGPSPAVWAGPELVRPKVHCSLMNSGTFMEKTKNQGKGSRPPGVAVMAGWGRTT